MARPRSFDTDVAVEKAMQVFWTHGYEGASLPDLLEGMGLTRGSLYKAFTDKKSLFLKVLEHYEGKAVQSGVALLTDSAIPNGLALKIIRFVQDVNDGMDNTISLKMHGTPISMRAYCLVFVCIFPFVFSPTIVFHLADSPWPLTYGLSVLHGFILIALYNVQVQMENPFDQIGLDDIKLDEFRFRPLPPA